MLKKSITLMVLLSIFVITQWAGSVYLPLVPSISQSFSDHPALIISSLSIFFLAYGLGQLVWGTLSDYVGRYYSLISALGLFVLFEMLTSRAGHASSFVLFLSLSGFAASANTSVGNALIKDYYGKQKARHMISYVGIAMAAAPVVAPIIGTRLYSAWGWPAIFEFLAGVGLVVCFGFAIIFKNYTPSHDAPVRQTAPVTTMLKETLSCLKFSYHVATLAISFGIFFSTLLALPFILNKAEHISVRMMGYVMFAVSLFYIIGALSNAVLTRRKSTVEIIRLGTILMIVGAVLILINGLILHHILSLINFIALAFCMLGIGTILPASKAGAMTARDRYVGTAASLMKFFQSMGCVIFTRVTSYFINHGSVAELMILLLIAVAMISLVSVVPMISRQTSFASS